MKKHKIAWTLEDFKRLPHSADLVSHEWEKWRTGSRFGTIRVTKGVQ
jgi:hypothetical protein